MTNSQAMNSTQQRERAAHIKDRLHLLYYAASLQPGFEGEQPLDDQGILHYMEYEQQEAVLTKRVAKGKGMVKGQKMKPGFCQHCWVKESTVWRCIVKNSPDMGYLCNRCAMGQRNNGSLPVLPNKDVMDEPEQLIYHLTQLAQKLQPKQADSAPASHKRAACAMHGIDNCQLDGKIKRSRLSSESEDLSVNAAGCSSDATTHQLKSQDVMMDTQNDAAGALLDTTLSQYSSSFTIPAYRGEDEKQQRLKREASRRAGQLLAVVKENEHSNASGRHSQLKGKKKANNSTSTTSSNSAENLHLQQTTSAMHNSGPVPGVGFLTGMQAQQQEAPAAPSSPLPAAATAQQLVAGIPQNVMAMPIMGGAGRNAPQLSTLPSNNISTAGNKQMQSQFVMPPYCGLMPQAMADAGTSAPRPSLTPMAGMAPWQQMPIMPIMMMQPNMGMAWGQHMPGMPMMMAPGVAMASGQHLPTPTMFVHPGMGMAFQAYAMQQLPQGQLSSAMCQMGNASS